MEGSQPLCNKYAGVFWDMLQLEGQFNRFSHLTQPWFIQPWGDFFSALVMNCAVSACAVHEIQSRKDFFVSRHDSWFQASHKVWSEGFTPRNCWQPSASLWEQGIACGERLCIGMSKLHRTVQMSSATTFSENNAAATSIRRGKVSPWWGKVFLPWN